MDSLPYPQNKRNSREHDEYRTQCFFQILPRLKIINRLSSSKDPHQSRMKKKSTMPHRKAEGQFSNPQSDIRLLSRNGHSFPFKQEIRPPHPLQANNWNRIWNNWKIPTENFPGPQEENNMSFQTPPHTPSLSPTGTERKTGNLQEKKAVCLSFIRTKRHGECESEAWEDWKQTPGQGQLRIFLCKKN